MDENNDKMRYTLESEDEMAQPQPMQSPAQPETAEPEAAQTDIDRASIPDKKTRNQKEKHLFFSIFHLILLIFVLNPPLNYKLKDNLYVFSIPGDKGY